MNFILTTSVRFTRETCARARGTGSERYTPNIGTSLARRTLNGQTEVRPRWVLYRACPHHLEISNTGPFIGVSILFPFRYRVSDKFQPTPISE